MSTHVIPYRLLHLQSIQGAFAGLDESDRAITRALLDSAGLRIPLNAKARRRVERSGYHEVWGATEEPCLGRCRLLCAP